MRSWILSPFLPHRQRYQMRKEPDSNTTRSNVAAAVCIISHHCFHCGSYTHCQSVGACMFRTFRPIAGKTEHSAAFTRTVKVAICLRCSWTHKALRVDMRKDSGVESWKMYDDNLSY